MTMSATVTAPFLFEAFAFFGRHVHPSLLHLMPPPAPAAAAPATAKPAKEDLGQDQQPCGLPEADHRKMKDLRYQGIPEQHHDGAENGKTGQAEKKE